jgi:phosphoribosylaminoimidazole-succinocarboxamide synthase
MATDEAILKLDLPGVKFVRRGKVRDIFDLGEHLLIVATDRISAFDVVMTQGIPGKGRVLTALSEFWFDRVGSVTKHHLVTTDVAKMPLPESARAHAATLRGRSMLVTKATVFPVECIVRGYLFGSAWKDYRTTGAVCGQKLPAGLVEGSRFPQPIFTPSTKAETGHDENISFEEVVKLIGAKDADELRRRSVAVYSSAAEYADTRGIIVADTKFEWGRNEKTGEMLLVDEILSPDSSRFWMKSQYAAGGSQLSLDKQIVRDWLEKSGWNKTPPPPDLPDDLIRRIIEAYRSAYQQITGKTLSN